MYHVLVFFIYWPLRSGHTDDIEPSPAEPSLAPLDSAKTGPHIL